MRLFAPPFTHRVADLRLFDLDDLGAEVAIKLAAKWARQELTHFDDPKIGKRTGGGRSGCMVCHV